MKENKVFRYAKKYSDEVIESQRSRYYHFGNHILRISDHIGKLSDGNVSIIIDKKGHYMIHEHKTGSIIAATYDQVKTFIRGMGIHSCLGDCMRSELEAGMQRKYGMQIDTLNRKIISLKDEVDRQRQQINGLKLNFNKYKK